MKPSIKAKVVFKFEQLLLAINDTYPWTFNLNLTENVPELLMNVLIEEDGRIKNVKPVIQNADDVRKRKSIGNKNLLIAYLPVIVYESRYAYTRGLEGKSEYAREDLL